MSLGASEVKVIPHPVPPEIKESIQVNISQIENNAGSFTGMNPGAPLCRVLISRLTRLGHSVINDWPVPVSDEDLKGFANLLSEVFNSMQVHFNSSGGDQQSLIQFSIKLDEFVTRFEDHKMRLLAKGARPDDYNQASAEIRAKLKVLDGEIEKVKAVGRDTATKQTIKNEQAFFANQATRFVWVAIAGLVVFICLSSWLLVILDNFHSSSDIMKDYLAQEATIGKEMLRFKETCPDCMRSLFINTLFKANGIRIVQVSFLLFLIAVALKSLNSSLHNYTINMHRSNALHAALRLFDKPETKEGKDALIDKAAAAIFSHQATGFNGKPPSNLLQSAIEFGKEKVDKE